MSAFNTLHATVACPVCGVINNFEVQFKYGDTWQYDYRVGDRIRWGGNDYACSARGIVKISGIGGPCHNCSADDLSFEIIFKDDRIEAVMPLVRDA